MNFEKYFSALEKIKRDRLSCVQVTVVDNRGSNPAPIGAKMLVSRGGLFCGTVGGGKIEAHALEKAKEMLVHLDQKRQIQKQLLKINLQRDLSMSCGGEMTLFFEVIDSDRDHHFSIHIFGAGHITQALVGLLCNLDCRIHVYDTRTEWLDKLPQIPQLKAIYVKELKEGVQSIPDNSYVLLITPGHVTDIPILSLCLTRSSRFIYLGVIGSQQKRNRLEEEMRKQEISPVLVKNFVCPIGIRGSNNSCEEIALSIAMELVQVKNRQEGSPPTVST